MTDQELADAIRKRFQGLEGYSIADIAAFIHAHPRWEPKWGDKVKHGANPEPRWYVAPNPKDDERIVLVDAQAAMIFARLTSIKPWEDES